MDKIEEARTRCEYASNLLREADIPHTIKNADIVHINLFYMGKTVMSFWARTGRYIYTVNTKNNIDIDADFDRGIKNCIKTYKKTFLEVKMDKYELMQQNIEKNIQELSELLVNKGITDVYMLMEILEKIKIQFKEEK